MKRLLCENLWKSFDGTVAVEDVDIEIPLSGITAVIGPNGAGKTTFLNLLTGFARPDIGRIVLDDIETTGLAPHRIARLGVARTFQEVRLAVSISVIENVLLWSENRGSRRGRQGIPAAARRLRGKANRRNAERILDMVGLEDHAAASAGALSYGQQKLLSLACCLAMDPKVLLLDEPVAGLHPEMTLKVLNLMRLYRDQGKAIVFIEHDIGAVRQVADGLVVMDHGRVIHQGVPEHVLQLREVIEAYIA